MGFERGGGGKGLSPEQGGRRQTPTGWRTTQQSGEPNCRGLEATPYQCNTPNASFQEVPSNAFGAEKVLGIYLSLVALLYQCAPITGHVFCNSHLEHKVMLRSRIHALHHGVPSSHSE